MKSFFKYVLASIIGTILSCLVLLLLLFIIGAGIKSFSKSDKVEVKENSIIFLNLKNGVQERVEKAPFAFMNKNAGNSLYTITRKIENAARDKRIKGAYLKLGNNTGLNASTELRKALQVMKDSGKFIYAYSNYIGNSGMFLGSVANKFYLNKAGNVNITGTGMYITYFKGLLDKLGVKIQIFKTGDFKSFGESFTSKSMSEQNRLQLSRLVNVLQDNIESTIAKDRKIDVGELKRHIDNLELVSVKDALKYNMIDGVKYADEVKAELKTKLNLDDDKDINFIDIGKYTYKAKGKRRSKNRIAILYANGNIVDNGEGVKYSSMKKAIDKIRKNKKIKAVVLRINSPGGSAMASEHIYRELSLLAKEKPLIASMGSVAASGGYYIAMAADTIVANSTTITGSIGVIMLYPNTEGLTKGKLGLDFETVNSRKYADYGNTNRTLKPKESQAFQTFLAKTYNQFTDRVEEGRKLDSTTVAELAGGRVWIGKDALENKLIDVEGGLKEAMEIAANKAGIDDYRTVTYPRQGNPFEEMFKSQKPSVSGVVSQTLGIDKKHIKYLQSIQSTKGQVMMRLPYNIELK